MGTHSQGIVVVPPDAGVAWVRIDQPDRRNALTVSLVSGLASTIAALGGERDVRALVITGTGNTFSAGTDLDDDSDVAERARAYLDLYGTVVSCRKPVLARVNGHVYGGAIGLVASCDLAVMAEEGTFGFPEPRMGMVATTAAIPLLRKVGPTVAAEMLLTGRRYHADHAAAVGLVNKAVSASDLDSAVSEYLDDLRRCGPEALARSKELLTRLPGLDRVSAEELTVDMSAQVAASEEAAEGQHARRSRREPAWCADLDEARAPERPEE